jgi:hypothetical protein
MHPPKLDSEGRPLEVKEGILLGKEERSSSENAAFQFRSFSLSPFLSLLLLPLFLFFGLAFAAILVGIFVLFFTVRLIRKLF